ncbi:MAG: hypothetical protein GX958_00190 [Desulfitobacterium sp.]|nr:hypothetical protein [Desulfitobacterium sp.]
MKGVVGIVKRLSFYILLALSLVLIGCQGSQSVGEENIKGFLNQLYHVESTALYEKFLQNTQEYILQRDKKDGLVELGDELFESILQDYRPYCTEAAMEKLLSTGYATKYLQKAYEDKCVYLVDRIALEKSKESQLQYYFIVDVEKRKEDGTTTKEKGEGIIRLNDEGLIDLFKITKQV